MLAIKKMDLSKFHVIAVVSNPRRYLTRYKLYNQFKAHAELSGVNLWTVETRYGDRPFEVIDERDPRSIGLQTWDELWHKENMINVAISRLPKDWEYVAWVDADIGFIRPDWANETVQMLQHHQVVQMFSEAHDLGPKFETLQKHMGFAYCFRQGKPRKKGMPYDFWHPGYAWAARREFLEHTSGLLDSGILGAGDRHMALAMIGCVEESLESVRGGRLAPGYIRSIERWQAQALKYGRMDIGYVEGAIYHFYHGAKKNRRYIERWDILRRHQFCPETHVRKGWNGLWEFTEAAPIKLVHEVAGYFGQRNEDSIDL